jgi:hypothetical protein
MVDAAPKALWLSTITDTYNIYSVCSFNVPEIRKRMSLSESIAHIFHLINSYYPSHYPATWQAFLR